MFDKPKLKNKDLVVDLRQEFEDGKIWIDELPKDILVELLEIAIHRLIFEVEGQSMYEKDWKALLLRKQITIDRLFEKLQENIKNGMYK